MRNWTILDKSLCATKTLVLSLQGGTVKVGIIDWKMIRGSMKKCMAGGWTFIEIQGDLEKVYLPKSNWVSCGQITNRTNIPYHQYGYM